MEAVRSHGENGKHLNAMSENLRDDWYYQSKICFSKMQKARIAMPKWILAYLGMCDKVKGWLTC